MIAVLKRLSSPPPQTLRTLQPTPSTVSYTVSTRPLSRTLPAILAFYIGVAVRILLGASTLVLLWTKWRVSSAKSTGLLSWVFRAAGEESLARFAESLPWKYLAPSALLLLWLVLQRGYKEESLTVLRGLGLQTSTTSSLHLRTPTTRFIPTTSIQDIFIHEAFKGFEVRFYLAVVVKGEDDVVVVFPRMLPRRAVLEDVWRGARACLYEEKGRDKASLKE
ncbi:hypothetical protein K458DRAFT_341006 [Lentithecium fluviatile CBS 122367]|uniref:Phosphatidylinositol N-acetylglucosaminyltransferase subunit H conserved domain-containing protein n=1 Tax=Lentithecium fluviatile CBS 122367 TaxID=1168545 RepID=A0A6G1IYA9_9PLEO|nr:hypothetical protein K458DRAFT_341006 [Lentithecium fluviatile CBS 122367]